MRIGFDVAQTCTERAGCGWFAHSLADAIASASGKHELVLYHHFGDWLNASTAGGTLLTGSRVSTPLAGLDAAAAAAVWADCAHPLLGSPDIVHANSYRAPHVAGARLVYTVYDVSYWTVPEFTTDANRLACQTGTLAALAMADGFVFISQSARDEFESVLPGWLNERNKPSVVIPLGARAPVPGGMLPEKARGVDAFWLAVGTLEPRKNYEALLIAIGEYHARSSRRHPLLIAGGGGWKSSALRTELERLESSGAVRYLGYVSDAELSALYTAATGFVFPSWYEGFGLPVLEAMTHGCPVISSDRTSLREVGGTAALYVDPAEPGTIVEALLRLESGPDQITRRRLCREQAAKFCWESAARDCLAFYGDVLRRSR